MNIKYYEYAEEIVSALRADYKNTLISYSISEEEGVVIRVADKDIFESDSFNLRIARTILQYIKVGFGDLHFSLDRRKIDYEMDYKVQTGFRTKHSVIRRPQWGPVSIEYNNLNDWAA